MNAPIHLLASGFVISLMCYLNSSLWAAEVRLTGEGDGAWAAIGEGTSHRLAEGEEFELTARVTLDEPAKVVRFQWFKNGQPFPEPWEVEDPADWDWRDGKEWSVWRSSLRFPLIRAADAGRYNVTAVVEFVAAKPAAIIHTGEITLEVIPGPVVSATPPAPLLDQSVVLAVSVPGYPSLGEAWWGGPLNDGDLTNLSITLPKVTFEHAGEYTAAVFHPGVGRHVRSEPYFLRIYPVIAAPVIVVEPMNQIGITGGSAVFTVGATGGLPLRYQWQRGQVNLAGATNFHLALQNLQAADASSYRVLVSNASGSATSVSATLTLQGATVPVPAADNLVAAGRAALARQTKTDLSAAVTAFAGALAASPTHAEANALHGVSRLFNFVHSAAANQFLDRLQVAAAKRDLYDWTAEPTTMGGRLQAPRGVDASEAAAFLHGQLLPELRGAVANLSQAGMADFTLSLSRAETTLAPVTVDAGDLHVIRAGLRFIEYIFRTTRSWNLSVQLAAIQALAEDPRTTLEAIARDYPDLLTFSDASQAEAARLALEGAVDDYIQAAGLILSRPTGARRLFNLESDNLGDEARFRQSVVDLKAALKSAVVLNEDAQWRIRLTPMMDGSHSPRSLAPRSFVGDQADAASTPEPLFANSVASEGPPRIVFPPVDRQARAGARVELSVLALGQEPLSFQWFRSNQVIAGATTAKLIIPSLTTDAVGLYRLRVSNRQGTNHSEAWVEIGTEPGITAQPEAQVVQAGRPGVLRVQAVGDGPLSYQWYRDGAPVPGGTESRLVLGDCRAEDAGQYTVRVSNGVGFALSQPVKVTVDSPLGSFMAPLFAEVFDQYSFANGPSRTIHDGLGGIYAYFQPMDLIGGLQTGGPFKLREADLTVDSRFRLSPPISDAEAVAIQPDGRILIAGTRHNACVIIRVDADGREDVTFKAPELGRGVRFMTIQPDGRILLAVTDNLHANPYAMAVPIPTVLRLYSNGRLDSSFTPPVLPDGAGYLYVPPVVDSAGRIYIGGWFETVNGVRRPNFARLLVNGRLDESYLGVASIPDGVRSSQVRGIGFQSDGRVVIVGDFRIPSTAPSSERFGAMRFNLDGTRDLTFAQVRISDMGISYPGTRPRALVVLPDDKLVVVANTLVRLNAGGTLDPTFNRPQFDNEAYWVSRSSDGRFFVPGVTAIAGEPVGGIGVFSDDGRWIRNLSASGFGLASYANTCVPLSGGRMAITGAFNQAGGAPVRGLAVLGPDGQLTERQFDSERHLGITPTSATTTRADADAYYLLASDAYGEKELVRVRADAIFDGTFEVPTEVRLESVARIHGDPDGRLLLLSGGDAQAALSGTIVHRLRTDGSPDPTFLGPSASVLSSLSRITRYPDQSIERIDVGDLRVLLRDAQGRYLVVVNSVGGEVRLLRLTSAGQEDAAFHPGLVDQPSSVFSSWPEVLDPASGQYMQAEAFYYTEPVISAAAELSDGRIMVSGRFTRFNGQVAPGIVRLIADGTVDPSFQLVSGPRMPEQPIAEASVDSIVADGGDRLYVAGAFSEFNGVTAPGLARLRLDGSVDETFHPGLRWMEYGQIPARLEISQDSLYVLGTFAGASEVFPRAVWRIDLGGAPSIASAPPPSLVGSLGGSIVLEVVPAGQGPFWYQWQRDGNDISGATSARLALDNLSLVHAGNYHVVVRNAVGMVTGPTTVLRVVPDLSAEGISFTSSGDPRFALPVIPGVRTIIEASDDLENWDIIADLTPTGSLAVVTDQAGRGAGYRFYRAKFYLP